MMNVSLHMKGKLQNKTMMDLPVMVLYYILVVSMPTQAIANNHFYKLIAIESYGVPNVSKMVEIAVISKGQYMQH